MISDFRFKKHNPLGLGISVSEDDGDMKEIIMNWLKVIAAILLCAFMFPLLLLGKLADKLRDLFRSLPRWLAITMRIIKLILVIPIAPFWLAYLSVKYFREQYAH